MSARLAVKRGIVAEAAPDALMVGVVVLVLWLLWKYESDFITRVTTAAKGVWFAGTTSGLQPTTRLGAMWGYIAGIWRPKDTQPLSVTTGVEAPTSSDVLNLPVSVLGGFSGLIF